MRDATEGGDIPLLIKKAIQRKRPVREYKLIGYGKVRLTLGVLQA